MVSVAVRTAPSFGATAKLTVPVASPVAPVLRVIHAGTSVTAQKQLGSARMMTAPVPPAKGNEASSVTNS